MWCTFYHLYYYINWVIFWLFARWFKYWNLLQSYSMTYRKRFDLVKVWNFEWIEKSSSWSKLSWKFSQILKLVSKLEIKVKMKCKIINVWWMCVCLNSAVDIWHIYSWIWEAKKSNIYKIWRKLCKV